MSYLEIKRIVEEQISKVSQPVEITDEVRRVMDKYGIPEEKIKNGLLKVNLHIKRQNKHRFSKQVVHQLVQQILKNEHDKLSKVNEQLQRVQQLIQPVIVPESQGGLSINERVSKLQELAEVLPEPTYLFALDAKEDDEEKVEEDAMEEDERDQEGLIVDDEARVERILKKKLEKEYAKAVQEEIKEDVASRKESNEELRQRYTKLREQLIQQSQALIYQQQKHAYLEMLAKKTETLREADFLDKDGLEAQITRFRIIVEKLEYATSQS
ncbi:hypothetical protein C7M61_004523 [Candidozyma pseudohaemuli]|uniref:Uncharacterized protein n=1 Tax=Candidozyma pseudohaemuli TaxID=418784 RepID=A0A2P7YHN7_9ASCO|nr:hypothetical protein C7M61_004523 [[Candida] pseudohaemulonii]PSK35486.1 hypothetical protein C7M61_004523 [[Candida] pseudohaemulonii]